MEHSDHGSQVILPPGRCARAFEGQERILQRLQHTQRFLQIEEDSEGDRIVIGRHRPSASRGCDRPEPIEQPLIPLLDTTLLTDAPGEPGLWSQLRSEITSADTIDVVMAFIRRSGIAPLLDNLHAKAWVFHRRSGFSTAYVGSSDLTHQAQVTGLEWNVRASAARNPDMVDTFKATFDSYWEAGDFDRLLVNRWANVVPGSVTIDADQIGKGRGKQSDQAMVAATLAATPVV